jgi:hypothetical protein
MGGFIRFFLLITVVIGVAFAFMPLAWVWQTAKPERFGVSAARVSGKLWDARMIDLRAGQASFGDVRVVIDSPALLGGEFGIVLLPLEKATWKTTLLMKPGQMRIERLIGAESLTRLAAMIGETGRSTLLPEAARLQFDAVNVVFGKGDAVCQSAEGRVALSGLSDLGLPSLVGPLLCEQGQLVAQLAGTDAERTLLVRLNRTNGDLSLRMESEDAVLAAGLQALGLNAGTTQPTLVE